MNKIFDYSNTPVSLELIKVDESNSTKGGIGKLRGEFFFPNGTSRNNRFYSSELWNNQLLSEDVKSKLSNKNMYGTIGHEQPVDEAAWADGKLSHIITNLQVVNGKGIGELLILDTPAGRNLKAVAETGSKVYVSSRATGDFKGKTNEGVPMVNPETFSLKGFDIVLDPGFINARPDLVESIKSLHGSTNINSPTTHQGESTMDTDLLKKTLKENHNLSEQYADSVSKLEEANKRLAVLENENASLKEEVEGLEETVKVVEAYETLGSVEEVTEALDLGIKAVKSVNEYNENFGSVADIDEAYEAVKNFKANVDKEAAEIAEFTEEYGSFDEIKEVYAGLFEQQAQIKAKEEADRIKNLSDEIGVTEEKVEFLLKSGKTEDEIKEFFSGLVESLKKTAKYEAKDDDDKEDKDEDDKEDKDDDKDESIQEGIASFWSGHSYDDEMNEDSDEVVAPGSLWS